MFLFGKYHFHGFLYFLLSYIFICDVNAQSVSSDSLYRLNEVVVKTVKDVVPNQIISRQQILALPSNSVADALKYMSGVQIKDYGGLGGQKTINVRSLGSQHVGVYLDGVRITNVQNGTVDLGKFSLSTLESVSLYNANKSELLMTASEYSSASTVYLKTHRPDSTALMTSYSNGSFGTHKLNALFSYKNIAFIDASFCHSDGDYPFEYHTEFEDTVGNRKNSDIKMFRVEGCAFYKGWQMHTYFFSSQRGLPGGIVRRLSDKYTDVGREWDRNFFTQLTWRHEIDNFGIRTIFKYTNDFLHYRSDYPDNISVHANNRYHQQDIYGAAVASYRIHDFGLSASTDYRWSDLTNDVKNFHYVYRLDSKSSLSAFYDKGNLNVNACVLYSNISDHVRKNSKSLNKTTWNTLASYSLGNLKLRAFYKTIFRAPTLNDLYYTLVGNRNLKPEYTKQFDIGFSYTHDWLDVQADWYYNNVYDRIVCLPLKGSYQWTMLNYGRTKCMGVDITANAKYKNHTLMLSATYQDDRNKTDSNDDTYNDFIAYSPKWSISAIYSFYYKNITTSLSHMFVDKRYWTADNSIEEPLNAYNCTDLKIGFNMKHKYYVEAECQNLFDSRYEIIQRWPMPGRRYTMTFKYIL